MQLSNAAMKIITYCKIRQGVLKFEMGCRQTPSLRLSIMKMLTSQLNLSMEMENISVLSRMALYYSIVKTSIKLNCSGFAAITKAECVFATMKEMF